MIVETKDWIERKLVDCSLESLEALHDNVAFQEMREISG